MNLAVLGATGRMGAAILRLAQADPMIQIMGTLSRQPLPGSTQDPREALQHAHVAIDFTLPIALPTNLQAALDRGIPYVTGITGLHASDHALLEQAAQKIPVLWSANMSIGITILQSVIQQVAARLDASFDIEVLEMHHRDKQDAPSGTALMLAECAAQGRGRSLANTEKKCRTGGRVPGEIGFSALRGGHVLGDCAVVFAGDEEVVEIKHHALTRDVFARGALAAARWIQHQAPGLYSMRDVFP